MESGNPAVLPSSVEGPCACTTLRKAGRAISRLYDRQIEKAGLTTTQFAILRAIERAGEIPLAGLATELVMERTSLYRMLRPLQQQDLVKISVADKGRSKLAVLTDEGRLVILRALPRWEVAQEELLKRVGPREWKLLSSELANLLRVLA